MIHQRGGAVLFSWDTPTIDPAQLTFHVQG